MKSIDFFRNTSLADKDQEDITKATEQVMKSLTYKDLLLSLHEYLILLRVRFFKINQEQFIKDKYLFLERYNLIELSSDSDFFELYRINDNGKMYLRYRCRSFFKFVIPIVISILALFGGYDVYTNPVLKALLEFIASIWQTPSPS